MDANGNRDQRSSHSTPSKYPAQWQASRDWVMNKDLPSFPGIYGVIGGWRYEGSQLQKMTVHTVRGNEKCNGKIQTVLPRQFENKAWQGLGSVGSDDNKNSS